MASSKSYLEFILDQLSLLEEITHRSMMGEYILYYRGRIFALICDDRFLVKITNASKKLMPDAEEQCPYDGAKPMLLVDEVDSREFLRELAEAMYPELPEPKKKTSKKTGKKDS